MTPVKLCSRILHFVTRVGAVMTGNQVEWEECLSYDPLADATSSIRRTRLMSGCVSPERLHVQALG
jgi:hypothetical protein